MSAYFTRSLISLAFLPFLVVSSGRAADPESKRQLEHTDYDSWNSISSSQLSPDGKWLSYSISPAKGDGTLFIREINSTKEFTIPRGRSARFSFDSHHAVYVVSPDSELVKKLKEEKSKAPTPTSHLEVLNLKTGLIQKVDRVSGFSLPKENADWVAFQVSPVQSSDSAEEKKNPLNETFEITSEGIQRKEKELKYRKEKKPPAEESKAKQSKKKESAKKNNKPDAPKPAGKKKDKPSGRVLVIKNLNSGIEQRMPMVSKFQFNESGSSLAYSTSVPSEVDAAEEGVFVVDLAKLQTRKIHSGRGEFGQVVFSKDGKQLAFLSNVDDYSAEKPKWSLYHWKQGGKGAKKVVDHETKGIPAGWIIASSTPNFFENGKRLVLNLRPEPEEKEEKKDEDENAVLDIWHWQDPFLQPQQKLRAAAERSRTYETILDLGSRRLIPVETEEIPDGQINTRSDAMHVLVTSSKKYDKMLSWDIQGFSDWYLVDLKTGKRSLVAEKRRGSPSLSPEGKFIYWWDGEQKTWHCMTAKDTENSVDLGKAMGVPVFNELHDQPSLPRPYGMAGWTADDSSVLIYDRWDIWQVDPTGEKKAVCLTNKAGRQTQTVYRYQRLDSEQRFLDLGEALLLSTTDHRTKASGFSRLEIAAEEGKENTLVSLIQLDESLGQLRKAKKSDAVVFSRSTFERFPDLWASTLEFKTTRRMTKANPQQDDFYWGSAELVHWKAKDGQPLDGILYKPEGFSPDKKYPLMVYFYERYSDRLHSYYAPAAGRSIINFSFYASRGYVIFVPDIPYKVGEPGPSAANAILPGVESIVSEGYIDEKRIGMQGHSWGGYQTAYLVTVTDMFACAESGAPVSNMTSAYGGIRWGSGMSRMFQYEKTQSRIGGTLWEARDKYLLNSPLFAADKVNTPLLILHNDEDTAVPWYQGIELFVALRRLEKPAWMLNYNGDPHWVMSDANRMDFATRMQQFFDHYLKGDPMPVWMADGIPAVDKGKEFGFEYVRPKKEAAQEEAADGEDAAEEEISPSDRK